MTIGGGELRAFADFATQTLELADDQAIWRLGVKTLADQLDADLVTARRYAGPGEPARGDGQEPPGQDSPCYGVGGDLLAAARGVRATGLPGGPSTVPLVGPERVAGVAPTMLVEAVGRTDEPVAVVTVRRTSRRLSPDDAAFVRSVTAVLGSTALRLQVGHGGSSHALHDPLTGLANRDGVLESLCRSLRGTRAESCPIGVLFIDLDGFKAVNDTLGHRAGDELLRTISGRLRRCIRPGDMVGRLSGDEFAVLCEGVTGMDELRVIGDRVRHAVAEPISLIRRVSVGGSIGLALSSPGLDDAEELLGAADMAMYAAKRRGGGRCVGYNEQMRADAAGRLNDATELRRALRNGELAVHFAPVQDRAGQLIGAEAVLVWLHPTRGELGADAITSIAAEAGLTPDVDCWLFDHARCALPPLASATEALPQLWMRLSDRGLADPALWPDLVARLGQGHFGGQLCLFVGPKVLDGDREILSTLDDAGVGTFIEFQTIDPVHAEIAAQEHLPGMRIGRRWVHGVDRNQVTQRVIVSMSRFQHLMKAQLVVTDIDTPAELATLRALDCDLFQGAAVAATHPDPPW